MTKAGRAGPGVPNHQVSLVAARRQHNGFLISRLAFFSFNQFLNRRGGADCIFKEIHASSDDVDDAASDVDARDLHAAAIVERKLFVVGLDGDGSNDAILIEPEEPKTRFKVERIVFDLRRVRKAFSERIVSRRGQWRVQDSPQILPIERGILFTHGEWITNSIRCRSAIGLTYSIHRRRGAGNHQQGFLLERIARQAILAGAGRIDELDLRARTSGDIAIEPAFERIS